MKPTIVAYDGIAVIVNSANPVKSPDEKQSNKSLPAMWRIGARSAFGRKISIYTRNTSSGTYSELKSWR